MSDLRIEMDSWEKYLALVSLPPVVSTHSSDDTGDYRTTWTGTETYGAAMRLAKCGWREGADQLRKVEKQVAARIPAGLDIVPQYDVAGDEAEVGRFLEGEPENMVRYELMPARKPVVKFVVSFSISSNVPAESIFNRGAAIAAAIDALESAGVRCEVWAARDTEGATRNPINLRFRVKVKGAEEALDTDRLAFAICHPSMLRRLSMRLSETTSLTHWERMGGAGYGYPIDPERGEGDDDAIILGCVSGYGNEWQSVESAAVKAREMIANAEKIVSKE